MVSSEVPNSHISKVILISMPDMWVSCDDPLTELDSHANEVIVGSNSFEFESTGRTFNVKTFSSDLNMEKYIPIVDGALAHD